MGQFDVRTHDKAVEFTVQRSVYRGCCVQLCRKVDYTHAHNLCFFIFILSS